VLLLAVAAAVGAAAVTAAAAVPHLLLAGQRAAPRNGETGFEPYNSSYRHRTVLIQYRQCWGSGCDPLNLLNTSEKGICSHQHLQKLSILASDEKTSLQ
jgi:hypothetical protein